ncbi:recombinase family protein [Streptomyces sp. NPDC006540]|uniref:recombinase family protein n=1 Tax=Streptomyces sp. NPDC006540 TaxID=3155353 RepID=UPI0033BBAEEE
MTLGTVSGMDIHAGVYGRQSMRRASGSEISTADQLEKGTEEAKRRGATKIAYFEDLGISAFSGVERPDFERMLHECRMGRLNMIIVYYISRLSRAEIMDAIPIVTELLQKGVTIVSVTEGTFRSGDMMDLIHLIFRLDAAHKESLNKSHAVRSTKARARAAGGYVGGKPPYGFTFGEKTVNAIGDDGRSRALVVKTLEPLGSEAEIIRWMWDTNEAHRGKPYTPGYGRAHPGSVSGLTRTLNARQVPTRGSTVGKQQRDSAWDDSTVRRILSDPRVAGYACEIVYKVRPDGTKGKTGGYRILRNEDGAPLTVCEPIIEPARWWAMQEWLTTLTPGQPQRGKTLLSGLGLLWCAGGPTMKSKSDKVPHRRAYRCSRPAGTKCAHPGENTISMTALDDYVARRVYALISTAEGDPETLTILAAVTKRFVRAQEAPQAAGERAVLLQERAEAVRGLEELYDDREAGGYSSEIGRQRFRKAETALDARLRAVDLKLWELDQSEVTRLPIGQWMPDDPSLDPIGPGSWWHRASLEEQREFLKLWIQRVEIQPLRVPGVRQPVHERVVITWHGAEDANAA